MRLTGHNELWKSNVYTCIRKYLLFVGGKIIFLPIKGLIQYFGKKLKLGH